MGQGQSVTRMIKIGNYDLQDDHEDEPMVRVTIIVMSDNDFNKGGFKEAFKDAVSRSVNSMTTEPLLTLIQNIKEECEDRNNQSKEIYRL